MIKKINSDLQLKLGLNKEEFKLAGVLILFNNLLQSLFKSQILTLGRNDWDICNVFYSYLEILLYLYRCSSNFIAAFFILGIIGLYEIPLDMMTITIAAITMA